MPHTLSSLPEGLRVPILRIYVTFAEALLQIPPSQLATVACIVPMGGVFLMWKMRGIRPFMNKWFLHHPVGRDFRPLTLFTSIVSRCKANNRAHHIDLPQISAPFRIQLDCAVLIRSSSIQLPWYTTRRTSPLTNQYQYSSFPSLPPGRRIGLFPLFTPLHLSRASPKTPRDPLIARSHLSPSSSSSSRRNTTQPRCKWCHLRCIDSDRLCLSRCRRQSDLPAFLHYPNRLWYDRNDRP
jgi:hypothetical protein